MNRCHVKIAGKSEHSRTRSQIIFVNSAQPRARAVLIAAALAGLLPTVAMAILGEGSEAPAVAMVLAALISAGLALTGRGYRWARWFLTIGFAALGVVCATLGIAMRLIDTTLPQEPLQELRTWGVIASAILFTVGAATLFASEALDDLCGGRKSADATEGWDAVSAAGLVRPTPAAASAPDPAQVTLLRRWGKIGLWMPTAAATIAWLVFAAGVFWLWSEAVTRLDEARQASASNSFVAVLSIFVYVSSVAGYTGGIIAAYVVSSMAALLFLAPIALPIASKWKNPARFLILRPFNRTGLSGALRAILFREISFLGHCYTLADADIRVPLWLRLPVMLGQLSFFSFRQRKIAAPPDISKLVRSMGRVGLRNFNWCVSRDKLFPVACIDAGWQACVARLVAECDCIVMDVSGLSENILWELELLKRTNAVQRTVFLVGVEQLPRAQAALQRMFPGSAPPLLSYQAHALRTPGALTDAARAALRAATTRTRSVESSRSAPDLA